MVFKKNIENQLNFSSRKSTFNCKIIHCEKLSIILNFSLNDENLFPSGEFFFSQNIRHYNRKNRLTQICKCQIFQRGIHHLNIASFL